MSTKRARYGRGNIKGLVLVALLLITTVGILMTVPIITGMEHTEELSAIGGYVTFSGIAYCDGEPIGQPIFQSPWTTGGQPIDEVVFTVNWNATGVGVDWATFSIDIGIEAQYQENIYAYVPPWPVAYEESTLYSTIDGVHTTTLVFGEDLGLAAHQDYDPMNTDRVFWHYAFFLTANATALDVIGNPLGDSLYAESGLTVGWDATFTLEGGWTP